MLLCVRVALRRQCDYFGAENELLCLTRQSDNDNGKQ